MPDAHANFAYSTVATAPSPATSGTSLVVASGDGAKFPAVPFNATVWVTGANALAANAEIVRVTAISTDTLTITRAQESTSARTVVVGDQIAATITKKTLTDLDQWTPTAAPSLAGHTQIYDGSAMAAKVVRVQYDAGATVTNTATLTSLLTAPFTVKTPFVVGDLLRLVLVATYLNNSGSSQTPTIATLVNGANVGMMTPTAALTTSSSARYVFYDCVLSVLALGGSGTLALGAVWLTSGPGATVQTVFNMFNNPVTVDTAADITVDIHAQPGANAACNFTPRFASLTRLPKI